MFPAAFEYQRAATLPEALRMLAASGGEAKVLAGGHSILPMMKLRLATPQNLVDIGRVPELKGIRLEGNRLVVGALTTHRELETSEMVARHCPVLARAASEVGDVQVRNRGTLGGNLAHADPASDLPAVAQAMEAVLKLASPRGIREVAIGDFILGPLVTDLQGDEIIQEISFATVSGRSGSAYAKFAHPASGYAVVAVAAVVTLGADGSCQAARVGVTGASSTAYRATGVEQALVGRRPDAPVLEQAAAHAAEGADLMADLFASEAYRGHLCRVMTHRALKEAVGEAMGR
ncbi:FAD binding domain-containing protein [Limnochorda pilosa]|uniref:Carbon-monoxide dehydrogenase n=1 Tax=Limnochorda pilosa TaxID=1555112 RepID=A0A0K2SIY6_LIMPI|nr:xanthine dehydrogenase family protein subunit M [Limnochorda pilosa]BAS26992.1 carbon-monoxide dehydrogenase [Limnochorda pilosa]